MKIFTSVVLSVISLFLSFGLSASEQNISDEAFREIPGKSIICSLDKNLSSCHSKKYLFLDIETGFNCKIVNIDTVSNYIFTHNYYVYGCEKPITKKDELVTQKLTKKTFKIPELGSDSLFEIKRSNFRGLNSILLYEFFYYNESSPSELDDYEKILFDVEENNLYEQIWLNFLKARAKCTGFDFKKSCNL